jgi:hypothetical protein
MLPPNFKIVDISLELDPKNFAMRTPAGFKKDMQFAMEVIKEHDAPGGAGQIVRGVHMRLHAGSHVDAPEQMYVAARKSTTFRSIFSSATRSSPTCATSCRARRSPKPTCKSARAASSAAVASCYGPISTTAMTAARKNG